MFVHACKSKLLNGRFPDRYAMKHFLWWSGVPFTHYSCRVGFSRVINGQIAAASGCLLLTHVNI